MTGNRAAATLAALLFGLLPSAGCGPPAAAPRPNVILITIDTLRQDRLSSYGYERRTTPFLDSLAADGVRFTRGYSTSSWTVPAISSLLTSLHPETHGVVTGVVSRGEVRGQQILPEQLTRLPELLREGGYTTFGITANGHLTRQLGYAQGFDRFANAGFGATADDINETLEEWREEIAGSAPYFLWLHYFDPHAPYFARGPWLDAYAPGNVERPQRLIARVAGRYSGMGIEKDDAEFDYVAALYDSEIAFTDEAIRNALHLLDAGTQSLIVVTSDHGEEFLDHGSWGHEDSLYEELIRVPMIVRFPSGRFYGTEVADAVSLLDVGPSLLDYLGLDVPPRFQGRSFMPLIEGERPALPRTILTSLDRHQGKRVVAVVQGDWKLVRYGGPRPRELLFHLGTDPAERESVAESSRLKRVTLAESLNGELTRYASDVEPETVIATDEKLEELRSLGYVR